ncbi:CHAT domain-containing protein [Octadecabacter sp. G9-8]|uniref:CHAT domain-containing protein n=1 Tax=Octadecabacter dasysiphoniae TaxID=2909341 RepID=A0ABS9D0A5_9RHOB|nr:CHAT domain-containing protein [Octadecabacter dasysiphoniae]MCF2872040.1 CHAT domain-containing protein [Octadecabacter dasysiphoniae]
MASYLEMAKTDQDIAARLFAQGQALWGEGKPAQALPCFRDAVAALPPSASDQFVVDVTGSFALALRENGEFDAALALYPDLEARCLAAGLDARKIGRQWAIALEQKRDFDGARLLYEKSKPDVDAPQVEWLKWANAIGLLDWTEGRLTDAATHLAAATAAMPDDPEKAAPYLAVLGNDARLALHMGNSARAYRLINRMVEIRQAVDAIPLPSETSLFKARAALAALRGDHAQEAAILRDGLDWIDQNDPDEWMHKLDLVAHYVAAAQRTRPSDEVVRYLTQMCAAAPMELAWIGSLMLSQILLERADLDGARHNIERAGAFLVGDGTAQSEAEIVATLAALAHFAGKPDAAVFLGKLALKYLALLIHDLDDDALRSAIEESEKLLDLTTADLRSAGRFQEVMVLRNFFDRVRRYALLSRRPMAEALAHQPVPFDAAELKMEQQWLAWRQDLAQMRAAQGTAPLLARMSQVVDGLLAFETTARHTGQVATLPPPLRGRIRLSFVPAGDICELHVQGHDYSRVERIDMTPATFNRTVADLRDAVSDPVAWRDPAQVLYGHLITPIADELDHAECLEIEASGALGMIPIGILSDGVTCLVERIAVRYVIDVAPVRVDGAARRGLVQFNAFAREPNEMPVLAPESDDGMMWPITFASGADFTRGRAVDLLGTKPAYVSLATHLETEPARPDLAALQLGDETHLYLTDFARDDFDMNGVRVALVAACSSGVDDVTLAHNTSLAALVLEKGAQCFVGTLWDISSSVADAFIAQFWQALRDDPTHDPVHVLKMLQSGAAGKADPVGAAQNRTGGIGSPAPEVAPVSWAAFAVFEKCNPPQPAD